MNAMAEMKLAGTVVQGMLIKFNDVFECLGPAAGNVSKNQGVRIISRDGFRIIFRLSGTGVAGTAIRLYLERYGGPSGDPARHQFEVVKPRTASPWRSPG